MADFLGRLAARSLGKFPVAQPVVPPMFSPAGGIEQPQAALDAGIRISQAAVQSRDSSEPAQAAEAEPVVREKNPSAPPAPVQPAPPPEIPQRQSRHFAAQAESPMHEPFSSMATEPMENIRPEQDAAAPDFLSVIPGHQRAMPDAWPVALDSRQESATATGASLAFPIAAQPPASAASASAKAPTIRVTIGRVEVRAEFPASTTRPAARPAQPAALSLEEYARQRREGKR
jgi:hypothetical protein